MALKHLHPHSFTLCNSPSSNFKLGFHFLLPKYPPKLHIQSHFSTHSAANQEQQPNISRRILDKIEKGFSSFGDKDQRVSKKIAFLGENDNENGVGSRKGKNVSFGDNDQRVSKKVTFLGENGKKGKFDSSLESKERIVSKKAAFLGDRMDNENARKSAKNSEVEQMGVDLDSEKGVGGKRFKRPKKGKLDSPVVILRIGLEICSKLGDVMGAIGIFDLAKKEGIALSQYHYAVILYLCSSAAVGVVQPAKSGRSGTNLGKKSRLFEEPSGELDRVSQTLDDVIQLINDHENSKGRTRIEVGDNVKEYALRRGFEIYEEMVSEDVPMNEAILTSLARMAMSRNDGDIAFDMVKKMKDLGINPRLRSYGPALSVFCNNGNLEKAFEVEEHMLSHGVYPEEPELELLLRVSIEACRSDKVYYLLHKLRTSVRKVLPSTADVIEKWFNSKTASRVGKRKWDQRLINEAIENGGGGWHGQGWLGSGKWNVKRSFVGKDGLCKCCGEKLVTIDLDPVETERFAESVAQIAKQRDRNSNFEKFQKWLDYYGPFEAVVDGANVGLFSQRRFKPSKVNTIANGIRQMLPSKKWPLVILHNRRITGDKMDEGLNKTLVEKWKTADALYATPTGSNDDWYWLYAAIKFKCLLVTNDEMRDHLFQLLGNDFFPKWKERHQVRFNFCDTGPVYHMPPPCSVVIQESSKGHWHIPIASEQDSEEERVWVCVTRDKSSKDGQESINLTRESGQKELSGSDLGTKNRQKTRKHTPQEVHGSLRKTLLSSLPINQDTILTRITAAEKLGQFSIDFQI